jgi:hypothetical protein
MITFLAQANGIGVSLKVKNSPNYNLNLQKVGCALFGNQRDDVN